MARLARRYELMHRSISPAGAEAAGNWTDVQRWALRCSCFARQIRPAAPRCTGCARYRREVRRLQYAHNRQAQAGPFECGSCLVRMACASRNRPARARGARRVGAAGQERRIGDILSSAGIRTTSPWTPLPRIESTLIWTPPHRSSHPRTARSARSGSPVSDSWNPARDRRTSGNLKWRRVTIDRRTHRAQLHGLSAALHRDMGRFEHPYDLEAKSAVGAWLGSSLNRMRKIGELEREWLGCIDPRRHDIAGPVGQLVLTEKSSPRS
jgi:hypothetical protein